MNANVKTVPFLGGRAGQEKGSFKAGSTCSSAESQHAARQHSSPSAPRGFSELKRSAVSSQEDLKVWRNPGCEGLAIVPQ
eukprot:scaffold11504_cov18-Tisochrysis_lutea.AAC.1